MFRSTIKKLREAGNEDVAAAITSTDTVAAHLKATAPEILVVQSSKGELASREHLQFPAANIDGMTDISEVNALAKATSASLLLSLQVALTPDVIDFTMESADQVFSHPVKNHTLLFLDPDAAETNEALLAEYARHANHFRGRALFLTVFFSPANAPVTGHFGVDKDKLPSLQMIKASEVPGGATER
jgi:hypothetical protein